MLRGGVKIPALYVKGHNMSEVKLQLYMLKREFCFNMILHCDKLFKKWCSKYDAANAQVKKALEELEQERA